MSCFAASNAASEPLGQASTLRGQRLLTEAPPNGAGPGGLFVLTIRLRPDSLPETDIARKLTKQ